VKVTLAFESELSSFHVQDGSFSFLETYFYSLGEFELN